MEEVGLPLAVDGAQFAVGGQQVEGADMATEAAADMVVLAVDVGPDRAADGDVRVPGDTGTNQPSGSSTRSSARIVARLGGEVHLLRSSSNCLMRVVSSTRPPAR